MGTIIDIGKKAVVKKPELLAPAGNLEKLTIAFAFGADAVYVGGKVFGLRKYADNFSIKELQDGIRIANEHGKKVYVVLNGFAHNVDIEALSHHLIELQAIQPHGLIISDMGVFQLAKSLTSIPLHVSTQASVTNAYTAKIWKDAGASRVILAREVSIEDCQTIQKHVDIELEVFVHGSMCASYSGKCVISNYTSGRDSNRGGCVQSCRHVFDITSSHQKDVDSTHIMNAQDLNAITLVPQLIEAGIASLKIEGRMKSNLYVATTVQAYRHAIDHYPNAPTPLLNEHLSRVSNRTFSTGGLASRPKGDSINYTFGGYSKSIEFVGNVIQNSSEDGMILAVQSPFQKNEPLHLLTPNGALPLPTDSLQTLDRAPLNTSKPNSLVRLSFVSDVHPHHVAYKHIRA